MLLVCRHLPALQEPVRSVCLFLLKKKNRTSAHFLSWENELEILIWTLCSVLGQKLNQNTSGMRARLPLFSNIVLIKSIFLYPHPLVSADRLYRWDLLSWSMVTNQNDKLRPSKVEKGNHVIKKCTHTFLSDDFYTLSSASLQVIG